MNPVLYNDFENQKFFDKLLESETLNEVERCELVQAKIESAMIAAEKANSITWFVEKKKKEVEMVNERVKVMQSWIKSNERSIDYLTDGIKQYMIANDMDKIDLADFKLALQKNPDRVEITDEGRIPSEFKQVETVVKIKKAEIKTAIKNGAFIMGAVVVEGDKRLVIK